MIPFQYLAFEVVDRAGNVVEAFNLTDGVAYALVSYAPTVAPRNRATLTGNATYADVTDTIQIEVLGSSASNCENNYERLMRVIEQGSQWDDYESVLPVRITAEVQYSTVGRLNALILGADIGTAPAQTSPELRVLAGGGSCWFMDVTLTFIRRGLWLGEYQDVGLLTTTGNPTVETVTFTGDQGLLGAPMAVTWTDPQSPSTGLGTGSFFALTASEAYNAGTGFGSLRLADWSTLTATNWTTVNDAGNSPFQGTNILRFTRPSVSDTAFWPTGTLQIGPAPSTDTTALARRQWLVIAAVRNNSTTVSFFLRARFNPFGSFAAINVTSFASRPILVDTSIQTPRLVVLGIIAGEAEVQNINPRISLEVAASSTTGAATFDVSYCALLATDDPSAAVVEMIDSGTTRINNHVIARDYALKQVGQIGYLNLSAPPQPDVDLINIISGSFAGDVDWTCVNTSAAITLLGVDGTRWVFYNTATAAKTNVQYRARRRRAYRSPQ